MKNKLTDLNNHLFTQIERLNEEDISMEDLDKEIKRAEAIAKVATKIIESSNISLRAASLIAEHGGDLNQAVSLIAVNGADDGKKLIESKAR